MKKTKLDEKEYIEKKMADMRKQLKYLKDSDWMFENKQGINPVGHLPKKL